MPAPFEEHPSPLGRPMSRPRRASALMVATAALALAAFAPAAVAQDPATGTDPLSGYTTETTGTTETPPPPTTETTTTPEPEPQPEPEPTTTSDTKPVESSGSAPAASTPVAAAQPAAQPKALAFTGAQPLIVGALGVLMLTGALTLHRRRRLE